MDCERSSTLRQVSADTRFPDLGREDQEFDQKELVVEIHKLGRCRG